MARADDVGSVIAQAFLVPAVLTVQIARHWPEEAPLAFVYAPIIVWMATLGVMQLAFTLRPTRFPTVRWRATPHWSLRSRSVRAAVADLEALGFVSIGVRHERTLFIDTFSVELWSPSERVFATVLRAVGTRISLLSVGTDGRMLYSGVGGVQPRRDHALTCRVGEGASASARFHDHRRAVEAERLSVRDEGSAVDASPSLDAVRALRLALVRRWYVARFGTDQEWQAHETAHPLALP